MLQLDFDGTVLTSSDSSSWTQQTSPTTEDFFGLSYLNSKFIGVGESGMIMTFLCVGFPSTAQIIT